MLAELQAENEDLRAEMMRIQQANNYAGDDLEEKDDEIMRLCKEVESLRAENGRLVSENERLGTEAEKVNRVNTAETESEITKLKEENRKLKEGVNRVNTAETESEITKLKEENRKLRESGSLNAQIEERLDTMQAQIDRLAEMTERKTDGKTETAGKRKPFRCSLRRKKI